MIEGALDAPAPSQFIRYCSICVSARPHAHRRVSVTLYLPSFVLQHSRKQVRGRQERRCVTCRWQMLRAIVFCHRVATGKCQADARAADKTRHRYYHMVEMPRTARRYIPAYDVTSDTYRTVQRASSANYA